MGEALTRPIYQSIVTLFVFSYFSFAVWSKRVASPRVALNDGKLAAYYACAILQESQEAFHPLSLGDFALLKEHDRIPAQLAGFLLCAQTTGENHGRDAALPRMRCRNRYPG